MPRATRKAHRLAILVYLPTHDHGGMWQVPGYRRNANCPGTGQPFADGGAYTGDVVRRAPDGTFTHLCRADDVLNLGGYKVVPGEIESVVRGVDGVQDAVVVGGRDADGLEQAVAYLVARPGSDQAVVRRAVTAAIRAGLAAYKRPARLEFLDELPTTSTGKVAAFALRKAAAQP